MYFARLLIPFDRESWCPGLALPQHAQTAPSLKIAHGKDITQHGGATMLLRDPGILVELQKEQRDRVPERCSFLMKRVYGLTLLLALDGVCFLPRLERCVNRGFSEPSCADRSLFLCSSQKRW